MCRHQKIGCFSILFKLKHKYHMTIYRKTAKNNKKTKYKHIFALNYFSRLILPHKIRVAAARTSDC